MDYMSESESEFSDSEDSDFERERSYSKYVLCVSMLFHDLIFGHNSKSSKDIFNHFMLMSVIHHGNFFDNTYKQHVDMVNKETLNKLREHHYPIMSNIRIKNGEYKFCSLEIIKPYRTPEGEYVCIYYTFWIRIFIRRAVKFIKKKKQIIRSIVSGKRQRTGRII